MLEQGQLFDMKKSKYDVLGKGGIGSVVRAGWGKVPEGCLAWKLVHGANGG